MHKFFAKTLFAGKKHHFLTHCHSTNDILLEMARKETLPEGFLVTSLFQSKGKGQRGNTWISEAGKNILASVLLKPKFLNLQQQHLLTFMPALAISDAINEYLPEQKQTKIKWPNDVMIEDLKIAGILTECSIQSGIIEQAVVGYGVNVNQNIEAAGATSLVKEAAGEVDLDELLELILIKLEKYYFELKGGKNAEFLNKVIERLYRINQEKLYKVDGEVRSGIVRGIDQKGRLELEIGGIFRIFNLKEIEYLR